MPGPKRSTPRPADPVRSATDDAGSDRPPADRATQADATAPTHPASASNAASATAVADAVDLAAVLEAMEEAVVAIDGHDRVAILNRAARSLLGLERVPPGAALTDTITSPRVLAVIESARSGSGTEEEIELLGSGRRTILARSAPQPHRGVVLVLRDVTEVRRLEAVRRDFVANVSHELRTPVSIIRANAETLLNGALERPEQGRRFVEALLRHADRLSRLIGDLLDISRIEAGKYPIDAATQRVLPVVRRVVEAVETKSAAKHIDVSAKVPDDLTAYIDPKALEQVLLNLVENAVKYTPDGGRVVVSASADGPTVRLQIEDDGPGIDPVHRPRIFERFYRVDPGRSREMGGTGLGLAIVKHLVDAMRGSVGVLPVEPHGALFWVTLPAQPPAS